MRELSIFCDESGMQEGQSRYYLVTIVLHDQSHPIDPFVDAHRASLRTRGLPDVPFRATPLMRGYDAYSNMGIAERKRLLVAFGVLVQRLPIRYKCFAFRHKDIQDVAMLRVRLRQALVGFFFDEVERLQSFDVVKVYYDNGQAVVTAALHAAIEYVLARDAPSYRDSDYRRYRLAQAADYLCEIEFAATKYENRNETQTDLKFFGSVGAFKKNWLKQARRKLC